MNYKTILATCYAVNPYKGSEDGMGWHFVNQIARYQKVIAITRKNNRSDIERFMSEYPQEIYQNIQFLYFDLPYWMRFWKRGSRGAMLYYYLWQRAIVSFIKKQQLHFDITHNLNFHNDWTPSFLRKLNKPMVWGPIGHHPIIPKQYLKLYPLKYYLKDRAAYMVKKSFWNFSPSLQKTLHHANHVLCMNSAVANVLHLKSNSCSILPSVATEDFSENTVISKQGFQLISVGRFVPLKGFDLTLHAFIKFVYSLPQERRKDCKLTLVGKGPEKNLYLKIITEHKVQDYVEIIEWIDRKDLMHLYQKASVFLFPSHEGAGMVVAEALSFGLPIVCLNNQGPGEFIHHKCGFSIPQTDYDTTVLELKEAIQRLYFDKDLLRKMSLEARKQYEQKFTWDSRGAYLSKIYNQL